MVLKYSKAAYKKRVAVERVFTRLLDIASLTQYKSDGIGQSPSHSELSILIMLLAAQQPIKCVINAEVEHSMLRQLV